MVQDGVRQRWVWFARRLTATPENSASVAPSSSASWRAFVGGDRPAVGETRIGAGTKIDNLVQIAHGVKVGRHALLAAQVGIAGSTVLEDGVVMAGQSGATGHVRLGRGAMVSAKSAVTKDVDPGQHVAGIPAGDVAQWREAAVLVRRLPELRKAVADLEARLAALEAPLMT